MNIKGGLKMENTKIAKKLVNVMEDCAHIVKNGLNSFHNYKYATAEDVLQKVNESLTKNKIVSIATPVLQRFSDVTNLKGNTEHLATVGVDVQLIDSESGESVTITGVGSGQDAGDKAVMKAQTAAIKYAYMMSFCIATGDDPEADTKTDENNAGISQNKNAGTPPKAAQAKTKQAADNNAVTCVGCGEVITSDRVIEYSVKRYGQPLCMDCQKTAGKAA